MKIVQKLFLGIVILKSSQVLAAEYNTKTITDINNFQPSRQSMKNNLIDSNLFKTMDNLSNFNNAGINAQYFPQKNHKQNNAQTNKQSPHNKERHKAEYEIQVPLNNSNSPNTKNILQNNSIAIPKEGLDIFNSQQEDFFDFNPPTLAEKIKPDNTTLKVTPSNLANSLSSKITLPSTSQALNFHKEKAYFRLTKTMIAENDKIFSINNHIKLSQNIFTQEPINKTLTLNNNNNNRYIDTIIGLPNAKLQEIILNGNNSGFFFTNQVFSDKIFLNAYNQSLVINNNFGFDGAIIGNTDYQHVKFVNSGTIDQVGSKEQKISSLKFSNSGNILSPMVTLQGDLFAKDLQFDKASFTILKDILLNSTNIEFYSSIFNIGSNKLTIEGDKNAEIFIKDSIIANIAYSDEQNGSLVAKNIAKIDAEKGTNIFININDDNFVPKPGSIALDLQNIVINNAKIVVNNPNWQYDPKTQRVIAKNQQNQLQKPSDISFNQSGSSFEEINPESLNLTAPNNIVPNSEKNSDFEILSSLQQNSEQQSGQYVHVNKNLSDIINNSKNQTSIAKAQETSQVSDDYVLIDNLEQIQTNQKYSPQPTKLINNQIIEKLNFPSKNINYVIDAKKAKLTLNDNKKTVDLFNNTQDEFNFVSNDSREEFKASSHNTQEEIHIVSNNITEEISINSKNVHEKIDLLFNKLQENLKASFPENEGSVFNNNKEEVSLASIKMPNLPSIKSNYIKEKITSLSKTQIIDNSRNYHQEEFTELSQKVPELISISSNDISQKFNLLTKKQKGASQNSSHNSENNQKDILLDDPKNSYKESIASFFRNTQMKMDSLFSKLKDQDNAQSIYVQELSEATSNNAQEILTSKSNKTLKAFDSFLKEIEQEVNIYIGKNSKLNQNSNESSQSSERSRQEEVSSSNLNSFKKVELFIQNIQEEVSIYINESSQEEIEIFIENLRKKALLKLSNTESNSPQLVLDNGTQSQEPGQQNKSQVTTRESKSEPELKSEFKEEIYSATSSATKQDIQKQDTQVEKQIPTNQIETNLGNNDEKESLNKNTEILSHHAINQVSLNSKNINNMMLKRTYHFINGSSIGNDIAIAAGEDISKPYTLWASGFAGFNVEKNSTKNKTHLAGGAIGVEIPVNDSKIWGLSLNNINFDTKYHINNKIISNNYIISLYNINKINNLVVNGAVFLGYGQNNSKRNTQNGIAKANWHSYIYGAHAIIAYNLQKESHIITPSVAMHYSYTDQSSYTETGAQGQNYTVNKKNAQILTSSAAVKYSHISTIGKVKIIPGLQLSISRDLIAKASNAISKFEENDGYIKINPNNKKQTLLGVAPSISAKINNTDMQLIYNYEKGKKSHGHTISLKISSTF
jgi:hypothetical protein